MTRSTSTTMTAPYGAWPSPISAEDVARARIRLSFPTVIGDQAWWQEQRPTEGGRTTIMHRAADGRVTELLAAPWNPRTRVHEYGGRSYLPVPDGGADGGAHGGAKGGANGSADGGSGGAGGFRVAFANYADQRLYLSGRDRAGGGPAEPRPLTPEPAQPGALRYADLALSADRTEIWCVQERHRTAGAGAGTDGVGTVARSIVAVPLDGSAAGNPAAVRELVSGADFFAFPAPSPDGRHLAWISWNHPRMPWDGTDLRVAPIKDGKPGKAKMIKGGVNESVLAPAWRDESSLYVVSDWSGWWNLYQVGFAGEPPEALYPAEEEFAAPLWQLGGRPFAVLGDGRIAVLHGQGDLRLGILDPETGDLADLDLPFDDFAPALSAHGTAVTGLAGGPAVAASIVRVDAATGTATELRREMEKLPDPEYLPSPREARFEGPFGRSVYALVYPPSNPGVQPPAGERPPYVVWVHGGPTSVATPMLDLEKAYFTSRGIGVVDVNYGGSAGYGRAYRERLRQQWGVVDVEDAIAAATALAAAGDADRQRLAIRGRSAGGWTALCAVTTGAAKHGPVFKAAASYFGVVSLPEFARQTHDFESRYLDGLVGPLPGFQMTYRERSPAGHVTSGTSPVLLAQGLDDPVVPPVQAEAIARDLSERGTRYAYLPFEGESHGFRKAETVITCLEAELSFYGQILGFSPPDVPQLELKGG
jgi:dipeptidyl aminopeptidase/acylaminoacyl peptidase